MKRVINDPDRVVDDAVRGYLKCHAARISPTDNPRVLKSVHAGATRRVGVVTGGGSGHEPAFLGYLGKNFLDAVAIGEVFSSPTAKSFYDAIRAAHTGAGVACVYGNYAGDNMNVKMAIKLAEKDGIRVRTVVANDDAASASKEDILRRRGVAGEILLWKVAAAAASEGADLDTVIATTQRALENTRSVGIGLTACTIAANGKPNFTIEDGKMELGIGHHGEPGVAQTPMVSAREMADRMLDIILPDLPFTAGDRVAVLVSGLGATPLMELYILFDRIADRLSEHGVVIAEPITGNLFTSLEMMGVTLTVMKLDEELEKLLKTPAFSEGWVQA
ncbi:MAG: dihydroxyacetone kinase subunit DhaK [Acidobacteriota bacterium]